MDPDACLSEIRSIVQHADDQGVQGTVDDRFDRLVNLVGGLDAWMSRGGFPPKLWLVEVPIGRTGLPVSADDEREDGRP